MPTSRRAEESTWSTTSLASLWKTSEATTPSPEEAITPASSIKQSEHSSQEPKYHAASNGEFTQRTHTFFSATVTITAAFITTPTTSRMDIATSVPEAITLTTATSSSSMLHNLPANYSMSSTPTTLTATLLPVDIDVDDNNSDRSAFFRSTFPAQTLIISSSEMKNLETVVPAIIPVTSYWNDNTTKNRLQSLTMLTGYRSNHDKYEKFINISRLFSLITRSNVRQDEYGSNSGNYSAYHYRPDSTPEDNGSYPDIKQFLSTNTECYDYPKNSTNRNAAATCTFPAPSATHVSQVSNAPSPSFSAASQQSNQNYFEDLWNDIAGPPAVIADSAREELPNSTTTIPPTNTNIKPLTFDISHTQQQSTHETVLSNNEAKHQTEKSLTSITSKIPPFMLNISAKPSLVSDNAEKGEEEIERQEDKDWGKFK